MKQNGTSFEENINSIYELLYYPVLDDTMKDLLTLYVNGYKQTLEQYHLNPSPEVEKRLQNLSGPINFINMNFPDYEENQTPHPAVDFIKQNISHMQIGNNKNMTRVLKPLEPNTYSEEENRYPANGFGNAIAVVILTVILGILLGILLNYIK